ncbi:MAG: universal stress protein [Acidobacteria bacterium]|nr:universal stress protein [Acidobacteriota bacterium]
MRILIATTGVLTPEPVADFVALLAGRASNTYVVTVIEVPRSFLDEIRSEEWHPMTEGAPTWTAEEDLIIARYVEERGVRITKPILAALRSRQIEAEAVYLEGEDPAATIVRAADDLEVDLVVLGATKQLFDESHWESVSARVMRETGRAVLVIPAVHRDETGEMDLPTAEVPRPPEE